MADIGGSHTAAFMSGINHVTNAGRANDNAIGDAAQTDMSVEFGQQAIGNTDDAEQAGQSMNRMMMQRAAGIGTDDDVS
jgi:hypothetical protein